MKNHHFKKSFSLIEVIIASAVLIMFMLAGVILITGAIRNVVGSRRHLQAVLLANRKIEETVRERDNNFFNGSAALPALGSTVYCYNASFSESVGACPAGCSDCFSLNRNIVNIPPALNFTAIEVKITVDWQDFGSSKHLAVKRYLTAWQNF